MGPRVDVGGNGTGEISARGCDGAELQRLFCPGPEEVSRIAEPLGRPAQRPMRLVPLDHLRASVGDGITGMGCWQPRQGSMPSVPREVATPTPLKPTCP